MRTVYLYGGEIPDKLALHRSLAEQLDFPDWYGRNLDALYDLLSTEREPIRVIIREPGQLEQNLKDDWCAIRRLLEDMARTTGRLLLEEAEPEGSEKSDAGKGWGNLEKSPD